ncbi:MAG: hypothetical protein JSU03_09820 [Bacteroidetes bacterium]|nr:hypothetical protein [Bacteroidota bacterium]MBS1757564.1 hypothetical protein [Bacteroidota bacterium]
MAIGFETEKNRKAFIYTVIICGGLLLMFFLISWTVQPVTPPVVEDLMEINLGNNQDGFGEVQPLIKGERSPSKEEIIQPKQTEAPQQAAEEKVQPDENAPEDAAPVNKPVKSSPKVKTITQPAPVATPIPKPQKPKITYNGTGKGGGNNSTEDNGYKYQGNTAGGKGDNGDPNGNKDSYGNTPGGKIGGPRIISGNRKIVRYYSFTDDLPKATIYAEIQVSPSGQGSFVRLVKPSTSFDSRYGSSISNYLKNIQFDKSGDASTVTVQFNFRVN